MLQGITVRAQNNHVTFVLTIHTLFSFFFAYKQSYYESNIKYVKNQNKTLFYMPNHYISNVEKQH